MTNHEYLVKRLDQLDERIRRMETRLCKLMIAMGVDPAGNDDTPALPRDYPPKDYPEPKHDDGADTEPAHSQNRFGIPAIFHQSSK